MQGDLLVRLVGRELLYMLLFKRGREQSYKSDLHGTVDVCCDSAMSSRPTRLETIVVL